MNFSKLTAFLDSLQTDYNVPGCDCVVFHHHRQVYRRMAGWADAAHTRTVSDTDLYYLFSASKRLASQLRYSLNNAFKASLSRLL